MLTQKDIDKALKKLKPLGFDEAVIDNDAAIILNSATKTVDAILKRRAELDQQGKNNEPLIILAGEAHNMTTNKLHHLAVITMLKKTEDRLAITYERDHTFTPQNVRSNNQTASNGLPVPANDDALYAFSVGPKRLFPYSPQSTQLLFQAVIKDGIAFKFNDAALDRMFLDSSDKSTFDSMQASLKKTLPFLHVGKPAGMRTRNHHMAKLAQEFAKQTNARIVMQICGASHMVGELRYAYKSSLAGFFKDAGLPVMIGNCFQNDFYKDFARTRGNIDEKDILPQNDLPDRSASYHTLLTTSKITLSLSMRSELNTRKKETAYAHAVLAKMNLAEYALSHKEASAKRRQAKTELKQRRTGPHLLS